MAFDESRVLWGVTVVGVLVFGAFVVIQPTLPGALLLGLPLLTGVLARHLPSMQVHHRRGGGEIELVGKTWRGEETRRTYPVESVRRVFSSVQGEVLIDLVDGSRHPVAGRPHILPAKVAAHVIDALNHAIREARSDVRVRVPIDDAGLDAALGGSRSPVDDMGIVGDEDTDALRHEPSRRTLRRGRRPR